MISALTAAAYIFKRYFKEFDQQIDEMKLHKMLYFAQRESLVQTDEPLFTEAFRGWKYGPVLKEIRAAYKSDSLADIPTGCIEANDDYLKIMDKVFENYAEMSAWSLSRLSHGELSWKNSRRGLDEDENGDNPISLDDIRTDAARIKRRREMRQAIEDALKSNPL